MKEDKMTYRSTSLIIALSAYQILQISGALANDSAVMQSQINQPNGVAGLDGNAAMTSPVTTPQILTRKSFLPIGSSKAVSLPQDKFLPDQASPFTMGEESIQLGGMSDPYETATHRALSVTGQPYSNYNAGCTLCIFSTSSGSNGGGGQAAISQQDYHGSAQTVAGSDFAAVGFYHFDENWPARVVAKIASFDANGATLIQPLTEAQQSQLHVGMYINTNVISPDDKQDYGNALKALRSFHGYLKSWDSTHLYVYHWGIPGGSGADGQVPDMHHLDKVLSTYTGPVAFIGVPDKHFAENEYMVADGAKVIGGAATTTANAFEREEFDWRGSNWSLPHSVSFHGWTTSFECNQCVADALDEDSYAYLVNGSGLPTAYRAQLAGDSLEFKGYNTWLGGDAAPEIVRPDGSVTSVPESVPANTNHIMAGFASKLPSNNTLNFVTLANKELTTSGTWVDYGIRLGLNIDGTRDRKKGLTGGSWMGSLGFNYAGHLGGVCTLGINANVGLCVESSGEANFYQDVTFPAAKTARFKGDLIAEQGIKNVSGTIFNSYASFDSKNGIFGGQGNVEFWNTMSLGMARTEYVNVDPTGGLGGFAWYNAQTSNSVSKPMFYLQGSRGAVFNVRASFDGGASLLNGGTLSFDPQTVSNGLYPGLKACDSYTICVQGTRPAVVSLLADSFQGGQVGSRSIWHPDLHGNWHAETEIAGGGAVSETAYRLSDLPTSNEADGAHVWCSDCTLNGIPGVEAFWHASVAQWTDSTNHTLVR